MQKATWTGLAIAVLYYLTAVENNRAKQLPSPNESKPKPTVINYFDQRIQQTNVVYQAGQPQAIKPATTAPQENYATTNWPQRTYQAPASYQQTPAYPTLRQYHRSRAF